MAGAHIFAARFHQCCQELQAVREQAEAAVALSTDQEFPLWLTIGKVLQGWALAIQGHQEEGLTQLSQGLVDTQKVGGQLNVPYYLLLLADVHRTSGQLDMALNVLTEALTLVDKDEQGWCEAELHRFKGRILLQQSPDYATEAESCFQQAITIAQNQSAKSWELRAATSLARLWRSQGKRQEAYDTLAPVYNWFTEGFDTADLQDAKALLDELSGELEPRI